MWRVVLVYFSRQQFKSLLQNSGEMRGGGIGQRQPSFPLSALPRLVDLLPPAAAAGLRSRKQERQLVGLTTQYSSCAPDARRIFKKIQGGDCHESVTA